MIFPEGLESEGEFATVAEALHGYGGRGGAPGGGPFLLANMTEWGKTPPIPVARFGELGYHCVIFPITALRVAMGEVTRMLAHLKESGEVVPYLDSMQKRGETYELLGYTPGEPWVYPNAKAGAGFSATHFAHGDNEAKSKL